MDVAHPYLLDIWSESVRCNLSFKVVISMLFKKTEGVEKMRIKFNGWLIMLKTRRIGQNEGELSCHHLQGGTLSREDPIRLTSTSSL